MNATASSSRIPPARPRPKQVILKRPIFEGDVIDLTGDDTPPKKRKRVHERSININSPFDSDLGSKRTIDLTKSLSLTEDDFLSEESTSASKNAKAGTSVSQEKVLQDSTNTGERRDTSFSMEDIEMTDETDLLDACLAQILEVIPDVDPAHVLTLLEAQCAESKDSKVQAVFEILFNDPSYPKSERKLMKQKEITVEKAAEEEGSADTLTEDYANINRDFRGNNHYIDRSLVRHLIVYISILTKLS